MIAEIPPPMTRDSWDGVVEFMVGSTGMGMGFGSTGMEMGVDPQGLKMLQLRGLDLEQASLMWWTSCSEMLRQRLDPENLQQQKQ